MQVARGGKPEPALQRAADVRDDVAKQVVGDDDLELPGILDQEHRERIDVEVARLDVGELRPHQVKDALPERVAVRHRVALVGHADAAQAASARELERMADDAVHALEGVDLLLHRDLVLRACLEPSADADVQPLGVLPEHDEVHVGAGPILQRAQPVVEQADGPVVDVQVELEARAQKNVARVPIVRNTGIAERADQHGVA